MSNATLERIEANIRELPRTQQAQLVARLTQYINAESAPTQEDWDRDLAAMAADPDIQREMRRIEAEFAPTETDGLTGL